jgi:hypothetical protein
MQTVTWVLLYSKATFLLRPKDTNPCDVVPLKDLN